MAQKEWFGRSCRFARLLDYLSPSSSPLRSLGNEIVYAGGLAHRKNEFLYKWEPSKGGYAVNLYGTGFDDSLPYDSNGINLCGFVKADSLIHDAKGSFGLVWDGDSLDECSGSFGEYLRLNNPHKASLYIRCGLPVLIWSNAALCEFITSSGIGIAIDSLEDIPRILSEMSREKYTIMAENVRKMSEKISQGYFLKQALSNAISLLR